MDTKAVYHHLVPQTYMKPWKHGNSSVYVVEKDTNGIGESKNTKKKFGGIDNYHSLRAGSLFRTKKDCNKFFKPLENHTVKINDEVINNSVEMNDRFYEFDIWTIIKTNGNIVTEQEKKVLKDAILSIHVRDIEVGWDRQYENYWNSINQLISYKVFSNFSAQSIAAVKRTELIKFMVSLEWRTKPYHPVLLKLLDTVLSERYSGVNFKAINIPENERLYPFLETYYDEFSHSYILKLYREFLDGKGAIMDEAIKIIDDLSIVFYIAPSDGEFITSDNPVCRFTNHDGEIEYIFPINPKIACVVAKGGSQETYLMNYLTKDRLIYYNNKLKENANEFYILRKQNLALYFHK